VRRVVYVRISNEYVAAGEMKLAREALSFSPILHGARSASILVSRHVVLHSDHDTHTMY
jgi:hypothetical protein